jgi:phosphoadenosine phosphosulfate reductase
MSQRILTTLQELEKLANTNEAIIVSYSTGKDSMILMDMACKKFRRVIALHMYFVKGLAYIEGGLRYAQERWGCEVLQMPHWQYIEALQTNQYCNYANAHELAELRLADIYKLAMQQTGARIVATGARKSDGLWRRRWMANIRKSAKYDGVIFPLQDWLKIDIAAYQKTHGIPMPELSNTGRGDATGISTNNESILWLYDRHREDYERMKRVFPHIDAVIARRELYGIGNHY